MLKRFFILPKMSEVVKLRFLVVFLIFFTLFLELTKKNRHFILVVRWCSCPAQQQFLAGSFTIEGGGASLLKRRGEGEATKPKGEERFLLPPDFFWNGISAACL